MPADQDNDAFWEDDSLSGPGAKPSAAPEQGPAGDAWQPVDSGAVDDPGARPSEGPGPPENAERVFMYLQVSFALPLLAKLLSRQSLQKPTCVQRTSCPLRVLSLERGHGLCWTGSV